MPDDPVAAAELKIRSSEPIQQAAGAPVKSVALSAANLGFALELEFENGRTASGHFDPDSGHAVFFWTDDLPDE